MPPPKTNYAQRGEINIAFQVVGDGPVDLVLVNGLASHMDLWWGEPEATAMLRRLGSFARVILFDKPGTGLSDP
ncbi:MAG: alpha/beta hydrolase, partial [Solirubrobacterales bacterium]|nr:alpha/beta hydrolase [Solirubrobacterales bacterium]